MLEQDGAWEGPMMVRRYAHLMPSAYRDEAMAFLNAEVDFHFECTDSGPTIRAIAVQSEIVAV
jgi:hypothetical protein